MLPIFSCSTAGADFLFCSYLASLVSGNLSWHTFCPQSSHFKWKIFVSVVFMPINLTIITFYCAFNFYRSLNIKSAQCASSTAIQFRFAFTAVAVVVFLLSILRCVRLALVHVIFCYRRHFISNRSNSKLIALVGCFFFLLLCACLSLFPFDICQCAQQQKFGTI